MKRIDYDQIAHLYDEPLRDHHVDEHLLAYVNARAPGARDIRILDIGCGSGKQLAADRAQLPTAQLIGIDRSAPMLRIASERCPSARWIQADAVSLPLASNSIHYATNQYSYPHIGRTPDLLREIFRVLTPGGRFLMTNIDPWAMPGWLVYRYFPEAMARDHQDFLPAERFARLMADAGFDKVRIARADRSRDQTLAELLDYVTARHRASQLTAISDAAYERGLQRVREAIASERVSARPHRTQFVVVTIGGDKG